MTTLRLPPRENGPRGTFAAPATFGLEPPVRPTPAEDARRAPDCPGHPAAALRDRRFCLLGRLTAHRRRPGAVGEELVAAGWTTRTGDRSIRLASAIIDPSGAVAASAAAVRVAPRHRWMVRTASRLLPR